MSLIPVFNENFNEDKEETCKGLFFRAHINQFFSSYKSIEYKKSLRFLKRKSCKGCEKCAWILDFIKEEINYEHNNSFVGSIQDGSLYKLRVIIHPGTYEYPNDVDIEIDFIKQNEKKGEE